MLRKLVPPVVVALVLGLLLASPAESATVTGTTAVKTQLQASPKITGGKTILWIPARTTLTLQCLAVGEKVYGAVAKADPYYYKVSYKGKTGYAIDADLYTAKAATSLGLTYCSIPAEPGSPKAGSVTSSSVSLSWSDRSNNETSFKTQYSTDGGKTWKAGASAGTNTASVTLKGLKASTKYTFQVGASNNKGTKWSAYIKATTGTVSTAKSAGACNATWGTGVAKPLTAYTVPIAGWNVPVCGPKAPSSDDGKHNTEAFSGFKSHYGDYILGYQCTELVLRWLHYRLGGFPAWVNGNAFAYQNSRTYGSRVQLVTNNGQAKTAPRPGDVISFNTSYSPGHVALVYSSSVNSSGNGTVGIVEQNGPGKHNLTMKAWKISPDATSGSAVNWLHIK